MTPQEIVTNSWREVRLNVGASLVAFLPLLVVSCVERSASSDYAIRSSEPTPTAWTAPRTWTFEVADKRKHPLGILVLEFTEDLVPTCTDGVWKRARPKSTTIEDPPLAKWYTGPLPPSRNYEVYPAYAISGRNLIVQLNAPLCDNYIEIKAELTESGAMGTLMTEGMFGGEGLGTVMVRSDEAIK